MIIFSGRLPIRMYSISTFFFSIKFAYIFARNLMSLLLGILCFAKVQRVYTKCIRNEREIIRRLKCLRMCKFICYVECGDDVRMVCIRVCNACALACVYVRICAVWCVKKDIKIITCYMHLLILCNDILFQMIKKIFIQLYIC